MKDRFLVNSSESEIMNESVLAGDVLLSCVVSSGEEPKSRRPTNLHLDIPKAECKSSPSSSPETLVKKHDLGFKNLTYTVKAGFIKRKTKNILHGVNGNFMGGELTAIMGPSGAGKSSLLHILSGYIVHNLSGEIIVNGKIRDLKKLKSQLAYITQDAELQPHLTVAEAMYFSANLKIGDEITKAGKKELVKQILEAIGMYESRHTRSGSLSGGQKKRLSIALELVCNPPILMLDEPTSGLDSSTSTQCVSLLKKLAEEGRTIVCTIHQPSALVFGMFDHLYALAEGRCIYAGGTQNLVPFLAELNLKCPEFHNPSDYLLEISTNDYGFENDRLMDKIQNGCSELYRKSSSDTAAQTEVMKKVEKMMQAGIITPVTAPPLVLTVNSNLKSIVENPSSIWGSKGIEWSATKESPNGAVAANETNNKPRLPSIQIDPSKLCKNQNRYAAPFHRQLALLLVRAFIILWRDKSLTTVRFAVHAVMGFLIGVMYFGIGNDAYHTLNNFRYIFFTIMFIMYTAFSTVILNFPLEFPIVSREHFNRWYSLRAYYVALTLADVPIQFVCTLTFVGLSYVMTKQPLELVRISLFFVMVVMTALVAQSIGLTIGALFSVKNGAVFGPFFICPFLIFSGFFVQLKDVNEAMRWLFHISFLKYSLEGSSLAVFGYNRPRMECNDMFCYFSRPKKFLKDMGMDNGNYLFCFLALVVIFFVFRIISFYIMSVRMRLFRY